MSTSCQQGYLGKSIGLFSFYSGIVVGLCVPSRLIRRELHKLVFLCHPVSGTARLCCFSLISFLLLPLRLLSNLPSTMTFSGILNRPWIFILLQFGSCCFLCLCHFLPCTLMVKFNSSFWVCVGNHPDFPAKLTALLHFLSAVLLPLIWLPVYMMVGASGPFALLDGEYLEDRQLCLMYNCIPCSVVMFSSLWNLCM